MLKKILIIVAALVAVLCVVVAVQPAEFRLERKTTIAARDSVVFAEIDDFHKWKDWSPWAKLDPNMKETYEGPAAGAGAQYGWAGNREAGEGRMTITESIPHSLVRIRLEFLKPFAATNMVEFTLVPTSDLTEVTWAMTGHKNFMVKAVHLVMNMEKMVGPDFEKGLAQLKTVSEAVRSEK